MSPVLTGEVIAVLTVTDADRSASWYRELLGAVESSRYDSTDAGLQVVIREPITGLQLCLTSRPKTLPGRFDEQHVGLDHLEFLVGARADLLLWVARLDELGITHSGLKEPSYGTAAMVTFRDPDNIQLEFYWPGTQGSST